MNALARMFQRQAGDHLVVSVQDPIRLSPRSEPQPDLALLAWRDDLYRDELPDASSVLLVVEVADTSVVTDRDVKIPLYGRAGIDEAWLVDLVAGTIEVSRRPSPSGYADHEVHGRGDTLSPAGLPDLVVAVSDALVEPELGSRRASP